MGNRQVQIGGKNSQCIQARGGVTITGARQSSGYSEVHMNGTHIVMKGDELIINGVKISAGQYQKHGMATWKVMILMVISFFTGCGLIIGSI